MSAGVRKPLLTNGFSPKQPGGRHMPAGVRKPPVRMVKWFLARMGDTLDHVNHSPFLV